MLAANQIWARRKNRLGLMGYWTWRLVFVLIFFPHQPLISSEIIRVVNGDSIIVYLNGDPTQVRLACIDAPEIGQYPYGRLAMNTFRGLLPADSTVKITPVREDRYLVALACSSSRRSHKNQRGLRPRRKSIPRLLSNLPYLTIQANKAPSVSS